MTKPHLLLFASFFLFSSSAFCKIGYWNVQRKGANFFNNHERFERFNIAKKFGIEIVRLAPNKWLNGRPQKELGDFLIGSSSNNTIPIQKDVNYLKTILDDANKAGVKVILTLLSLPGNRWNQHNGGKQQREIWKSFKAQNIAIQFWVNLAEQLKGHPALIGYNIKNEPSPELVAPIFSDWYPGDYQKWYKKIEGTPADLNLFYEKTVKAIRKVDEETPIVLDSGFYATPWAFKILKPVSDSKVIYSFHMYEPYAFTSHQNNGKFSYPGKIPTGETGTTILSWDRKQVVEFLRPIKEWQVKHKIPSSRVFAGEFGLYRYNQTSAQYLKDVIEAINFYGWHWAFYSFREDDWHGMDYELGTNKPKPEYWEAIEQGRFPNYSSYKPNSLFTVLKRALKQ